MEEYLSELPEGEIVDSYLSELPDGEIIKESKDATNEVKPEKSLVEELDGGGSLSDFMKTLDASIANTKKEDIIKIPDEPTLDQKSDRMEEELSMKHEDVTLSDVASRAAGTYHGVARVFGDVGIAVTDLAANMLPEDAEKWVKSITAESRQELADRVKEAGTAGAIGEFIGSAFGATKTLAQLAFYESVKSAGRHDLFGGEGVTADKFFDVAAETGTAVAFGHVINKLFPSIDKESLTGAGVSFEALSKAQQAEKLPMILQAEKLGLDKLDDKAQSVVINQILKHDNPNINEIINEGLSKAFDKSKASYNSAYEKAKEIAVKSKTVKRAGLNKSINSTLPKTTGTGQLSAGEEVIASKIRKLVAGYGKKTKDSPIQEASDIITQPKLNLGTPTKGSVPKRSKSDLNMADLESIRKDISDLASTKKGKKHGVLINNALKIIDSEIDHVAKASGIDKNLFRDARDKYKKHITEFGGLIKGEGHLAGKKIQKVVDEESGDAVDLLFGSGMKNTHVAKRMSKEFSHEERMAMVVHQAIDGIDINTASGASAALSRLSQMKPKALEHMIGSKAAKELKSNMALLSEINKTGGSLIESSLTQDLRYIVFGSFLKAGGLHPLRGASLALQGTTNLLKKSTGLISRDHDKLIKRVKQIKSKPARNKALHLINKLYAESGEKREYKKEKKASKQEEASFLDMEF